MGCCLSSSNRHPTNHQNASSRHHSPPSKPPPAPPQPVAEEESVKEVLSETSVPTQQQIRVPILQHKCSETPSLKGNEAETNSTDLINKQEEEEEEEEDSRVQVSQLSEMCSSINSGTMSTATTVTENREDEMVSKRVNRSPLRKRPHTNELRGATERPSKSPARRGNTPTRGDQVGSRPGRGRRELSGQVRNIQRSVRSRSSEVMRDSGEGAGRRSRSPATRKAGGVGKGGLGDSPARVTGRGRGMRLVGAGHEVVEAGKEEENGGQLQKQGNESLDNPEVSMECFIFL